MKATQQVVKAHFLYKKPCWMDGWMGGRKTKLG